MKRRFHPISRDILAVFTGVVAGAAVISVFELFGIVAFPPVPDTHSVETMHSASVGALLILEMAYAFGSVSGGLTAASLGVGGPMLLAAITGVVLALGSLLNLAILQHPLWFVVGSTLTIIPLAILGGRLSLSKSLVE